MNKLQAIELKILIETVRHVKEMNTYAGYAHARLDGPGCLLCEGIRHGLYTTDEVQRLTIDSIGFKKHFGCVGDEAGAIIFHRHIVGESNNTTGENYYAAGKELLEKYGYGHLFEFNNAIEEVTRIPKAKSFTEIMDEMNKSHIPSVGADV